MLTAARLDAPRSPARNLGSTAKVRSRKCCWFKTNDGPAALPVTVSTPHEQHEGGSRTGAPSYGQRQSPRCLTGPCCRQLSRTLQISHGIQTAQSPSTWLTLLKKNNPYYHFFFCNKLKALFTNSINCHTVRIYGEILNYICSCKGWKILLILMVRLIHKFNTFSQIILQTQLLWEKEN